MVTTALLLFALAAEPALVPVTVRAAGPCPSGRAVSEALAALVAPTEQLRAPDLAEIELRGAVLVISLRRASGELVGQRELDAPAGCQERAESAAVILAAWETRPGAHPAGALRLPLTPPPPEGTTTTGVPPPQPAATATAAAAPASVPSPPSPAAPSGAPPTVAARAAPAVAPEPTRPQDSRGALIQLSGALFAAVNADDEAAAVAAEAAWSRAPSGFGIGGGALYVASHTTSVSPGVGSWRRFGVVADGRRRASWSGVWLEARAGLALTALAIKGSSLADSGGGNTFDPGALGGLRVGLPQGALNPWLEVAATFWPRPQTLYVRDGGEVDLPRFELLVGVGLSFGWRR
jgi:hypothetical protein